MIVSMKKRVMVWGERIEIEVYKSSPTVWIATGEYRASDMISKDRGGDKSMARDRQLPKQLTSLTSPV